MKCSSVPQCPSRYPKPCVVGLNGKGVRGVSLNFNGVCASSSDGTNRFESPLKITLMVGRHLRDNIDGATGSHRTLTDIEGVVHRLTYSDFNSATVFRTSLGRADFS